MDKATPSITTAPVASDIIEGQTLASSTLGDGVASVPGDFAFTTPSTQPALGTSSQSVTFTPADSDNYLATTLTVNVNVNPVPNLAPVPGNPSVTRSTPGLRVSLLLLATDAEYDLLVFSNLTSSIGATVKISGPYLVYQAPTSNDTRGDTVSYVVSDGISTARGTLTVTDSGPTGGEHLRRGGQRVGAFRGDSRGQLSRAARRRRGLHVEPERVGAVQHAGLGRVPLFRPGPASVIGLLPVGRALTFVPSRNPLQNHPIKFT